jgi:hypothetical protein
VIIDIPDDDAQQVRAILLTHAEMQDRMTLDNEALRGKMAERMKSSSDPSDEQATIDDLADIHQDIVEDRDNLKRIADYFGHE